MSNFTGRQQDIEVDGKTYKLSRLTKELTEEFCEWAKPFITNPLDDIIARLPRLKDFPDIAMMLVKDARQDAKTFGKWNSPEVQGLLRTPAGGIKLVELMLQKHHPNISEDEKHDIAYKFYEQDREKKLQAVAKKLKKAHPDLTEEEARQLAEEELATELEDSFRPNHS